MAAQAVVIVPPTIGTNELALYSLANRVNAMQQRNSYADGKMDQIAHQLDRLETGFILLVVLNVGFVAAHCFRAARAKAKDRPAPGS